LTRMLIAIGLLVVGPAFVTATSPTDGGSNGRSLLATREAQRTAAFVAARNAEIDASLAAYETRRSEEFAAARNAEIDASLAAYETRRSEEFAAARNAEIEISLANDEAQRSAIAFAEARNAEIEAAIAAYDSQRRTKLAKNRNAEIVSIAVYRALRRELETGSIDVDQKTTMQTPGPVSAQIAGADDCAAMADAARAIQFATATARVDEQYKPALDALAVIAKRCTGVSIEIHGHADASGPARANERLSERRAKSVAAYLIARGVDARRLVRIGHGEAAPIAPNDTPENRARNRRIEFTLKDDDSRSGPVGDSETPLLIPSGRS